KFWRRLSALCGSLWVLLILAFSLLIRLLMGELIRRLVTEQILFMLLFLFFLLDDSVEFSRSQTLLFCY
ncbi:energy-coupling factor ABC transporter transmembrane protein, partial [Salmonella enterica subsp. enterica serovar Infantis]